MAILEEGWGIRVGNGGSDGEQGIRTARTERWGPLKTVLWASERDPGTDFGPELGFLLRAIWWRLVTSGNTCAIHSCPATVPQSPDFDHLSVAVVFFLLLGFLLYICWNLYLYKRFCSFFHNLLSLENCHCSLNYFVIFIWLLRSLSKFFIQILYFAKNTDFFIQILSI